MLEIISCINKKTTQERITAGKLLRYQIAPNSEETGYLLSDIDNHQPFAAIYLLDIHCDKKDYGKLVERVTKLFKPSSETTTGRVVNETRSYWEISATSESS